MLEIISGNVCSLGAMLCDSFSGTRKTKKGILLAQTCSQVFFLVSAILLNAYSAAAQNIVAIFRNIYGAGTKKSKIVDWVLVFAPVVLGFAFNNLGILGVVPIVANLQYSVIVLVFNSKTRAIKTSFTICNTMFIFFNFMIKNYVGSVSCIIVVSTTLIAMYKESKKND